MKRPKKIFLVVFLLTAVIITFFAFQETNRRSEPSPRAIVWDSPEKNVYLVQTDSSAKIRMGSEAEMKFDQTFLSRMAMKVLSQDEVGLYAVVRLIDPTYRVMGQPIPLRIGENANVVLHFGRGGEIRRMFFPADFGESESQLLRQLFLTMEIHLAPELESWEWQSAQDRTTADYRFRISGRTLGRKTLRYQNEDAESVTVLSSDFSCEISPTFWIDNVYAYEEKAMTIGFAESDGYLRLSMKRVPPMPSDPALWDETDDLKTVFSKMRQPGHTTARSSRTPALTASANATAENTPRLSREQIGEHLDGVIPSLLLDDHEGLDAFIRFLEETPDANTMLPTWLLDNGDRISDSQHAILLFALEQCGSGEAQAALTTLASDERHGELDNARAIVALGGVRHIEDDSIRFLQTLSRKNATDRDRLLANTAILNLGAAADQLRTSDPFAYETLLSDIRKDLHDSRNDPTRSEAILKAMGNIHDSSLVSEIAPYTDAAENTLRAAAYEALRFMEGDESEQLIRKGLTSERDEEARFALSGALAYREPEKETVGMVMDAIRREDDAFVINNMLGYVYKAPDDDGSIGVFLRDSLQNEKLPADTRRGMINELRKRAD